MTNQLLSTENPRTTMTLKEITDLLDVRHNDAMRVVEKMAKDQDFGAFTKISYMVKIGSGAERAIETYQLTKRQSIAVAARLNTALLMRIIDRWQELEQVTQTIANTLQVNKEDMIKELKLDDTIAMLKNRIEARNLKLQALKDKLAKQKQVLDAKTTKLLAQGAKVKGDMTASKLDLPVDTITNLLKAHSSKLRPSEANNALVNLGYLEPTKDKITMEGNYYGRTVVSSKSTHTTLARWFPAEFESLLEQINQYYLDKEQG